MALRNVLQMGDPVLRKKCKPVMEFDARLHELLDDMAETMHVTDGVGLAAPQVGIIRRVAVVDIGEGLVELINPVMLESEGEQTDIEGCLSVDGVIGEVTRPYYVKVEAQDRFGEKRVLEAEGFMARAFCHEMDHLDGQLFVDKIIEGTKRYVDSEEE